MSNKYYSSNRMLGRPEGGPSRNTAPNMLSEQYQLAPGKRRFVDATVRRVACASVLAPRPLQAHERIVSKGCQGVVILAKDRYQ